LRDGRSRRNQRDRAVAVAPYRARRSWGFGWTVPPDRNPVPVGRGAAAARWPAAAGPWPVVAAAWAAVAPARAAAPNHPAASRHRAVVLATERVAAVGRTAGLGPRRSACCPAVRHPPNAGAGGRPVRRAVPPEHPAAVQPADVPAGPDVPVVAGVALAGVGARPRRWAGVGPRPARATPSCRRSSIAGQPDAPNQPDAPTVVPRRSRPAPQPDR